MASPEAAPFDPELVERVAGAHGVDPGRLATLLERVARTATAVRSVDDLVYEYRRAFAGDTLAARTAEAFYLRVPEVAWSEFGEALDASTAELAAVRAVHSRAFDRAVGPDGTATDGESTGADATLDASGEAGQPLVLYRD